MAWFILFLAGLLEVGWAVGLKASAGFTRPLPTAVTVVCLAASMILLAMAMRSLPVGTAYAVWTGIGAVGVATLGMMYFGDAVTPLRVTSLTLIVLGIAGLKLGHP